MTRSCWEPARCGKRPVQTAGDWILRLTTQRLSDYRREILKLGRRENSRVVTGSGNVDLNARLFTSTRVEPWILTTIEAEKGLQEQLGRLGRGEAVKIISTGMGAKVDLAAAVRLLREQHGIGRLLCEGGPNLYGQMLGGGLIDEDFRALSLQGDGASHRGWPGAAHGVRQRQLCTGHGTVVPIDQPALCAALPCLLPTAIRRSSTFPGLSPGLPKRHRLPLAISGLAFAASTCDPGSHPRVRLRRPRSRYR